MGWCSQQPSAQVKARDSSCALRAALSGGSTKGIIRPDTTDNACGRQSNVTFWQSLTSSDTNPRDCADLFTRQAQMTMLQPVGIKPLQQCNFSAAGDRQPHLFCERKPNVKHSMPSLQPPGTQEEELQRNVEGINALQRFKTEPPTICSHTYCVSNSVFFNIC